MGAYHTAMRERRASARTSGKAMVEATLNTLCSIMPHLDARRTHRNEYASAWIPSNPPTPTVFLCQRMSGETEYK